MHMYCAHTTNVTTHQMKVTNLKFQHKYCRTYQHPNVCTFLNMQKFFMTWGHVVVRAAAGCDTWAPQVASAMQILRACWRSPASEHLCRPAAAALRTFHNALPLAVLSRMGVKQLPVVAITVCFKPQPYMYVYFKCWKPYYIGVSLHVRPPQCKTASHILYYCRAR